MKKQRLIGLDRNGREAVDDQDLAFTVHSEVSYDKIMRSGHDFQAELVSEPHERSAAGLKTLAGAFDKAVDAAKTGVEQTTYPQLDPTESSDPPAARGVTARWQDNNASRGGVQTTMGIAAAHLLSDDPSVRENVADLYVNPKTSKSIPFKNHLADAISIQNYLDSDHLRKTYDAKNPPGSSDNHTSATSDGLGDPEDQKYRVRLAVLMSLLDANVTPGKGMEKNTFGANIKSYSSLAGLGVNDDYRRKIEFLKADKEARAGMDRHLVEEYRRKYGPPKRYPEKISGPEQAMLTKMRHVVGQIGNPGLSAQAKYENGAPIPNFLGRNDGRLYTVIEARHANAPMNERMKQLLMDQSARNRTSHVAALSRMIDFEQPEFQWPSSSSSTQRGPDPASTTVETGSAEPDLRHARRMIAADRVEEEQEHRTRSVSQSSSELDPPSEALSKAEGKKKED